MLELGSSHQEAKYYLYFIFEMSAVVAYAAAAALLHIFCRAQELLDLNWTFDIIVDKVIKNSKFLV